MAEGISLDSTSRPSPSWREAGEIGVQPAVEQTPNRSSWDVLASLRRVGAPYRRSPTELYRALMRTSGGMTHLVDRLEREGLVERVANPDDRRGLLVGLTRKGRALVSRIGPNQAARRLPKFQQQRVDAKGSGQRCVEDVVRSVILLRPSQVRVERPHRQRHL